MKIECPNSLYVLKEGEGKKQLRKRDEEEKKIKERESSQDPMASPQEKSQRVQELKRDRLAASTSCLAVTCA